MVQATDLPAMDMGGVSDPYVKVSEKIKYTLLHTRDGIALEFRGDCPFIIAIARFKTWT